MHPTVWHVGLDTIPKPNALFAKQFSRFTEEKEKLHSPLLSGITMKRRKLVIAIKTKEAKTLKTKLGHTEVRT